MRSSLPRVNWLEVTGCDLNMDHFESSFSILSNVHDIGIEAVYFLLMKKNTKNIEIQYQFLTYLSN